MFRMTGILPFVKSAHLQVSADEVFTAYKSEELLAQSQSMEIGSSISTLSGMVILFKSQPKKVSL